eukprot:CAMPEP_0114007542 /NCGR_PEP_ID=MMETSP0372-20130328/4927_1 /TAXON_ID=340204 /ORGANISM="Lankesteria abbotti" /LENGTH=33 /assembly_acc=CAM_ASM_000359
MMKQLNDQNDEAIESPMMKQFNDQNDEAIESPK